MYFFWTGGAAKKILSHCGRREPRKCGNRWVSLWCFRTEPYNIRAACGERNEYV